MFVPAILAASAMLVIVMDDDEGPVLGLGLVLTVSPPVLPTVPAPVVAVGESRPSSREQSSGATPPATMVRPSSIVSLK